MASKIRGLQQWCHRRTVGYKDVNIADMSASWRDGLAFCAIIHRFRPDLIDFNSLSKENILENNQLAFEVAENELDIPAFLDAPDMVRMKKPDKLSIVTYVSQYYNYFNDKPELGGPDVSKVGAKGSNSLKRPSDNSISNNVKEQNGVSNTSKTGTLGDRCAICDGKVYLLERHVDNNKLYHRLCFRHSTMSPTNKVYNSPVDSMANTSKVRKIEHKTNSDLQKNFEGKKSLFSGKKTTNYNGESSNINSPFGTSRTPTKYHEHALDFLSRESDNFDKSKQFLTSTPKSKYEDKTSLTIISTGSDATKASLNSVLDSKSKWQNDDSAMKLTKSKDEPKISLTNRNNEYNKKTAYIMESKTKEVTKFMEPQPQDPKPEATKSSLREFLKKFDELGDKDQTVSTPAKKTFDQMEVEEVPIPIVPITKKQHNLSQEKSMNWPTENHEATSSSVKCSLIASNTDIGTQSIVNKTKPELDISSSNGLKKHTDATSNSFQSHLYKHSDKDSNISKLKKDSEAKSSIDLVKKVDRTLQFNDVSSATPYSKILTTISNKKLETKSDSNKSDFHKTKETTVYNKYSNIPEPTKLVVSPVAKPRSILKASRLEEDMDTTKTAKTSSYIKPAPAPRSLHNTNTIKEDIEPQSKPKSRTKSPVTAISPTRVKSPTRSTASARPKSTALSELKLSSVSNRAINNKTSKLAQTPDSPPPLPFSPPPTSTTPPTSSFNKNTQKTVMTNSKPLEQSPPPLPRKSYLDQKEISSTPPLPPRSSLKITSHETYFIGTANTPPKPQRLTIDSEDRKETGRTIDEAISKAMSPQSSPESVAVLVSPSVNTGTSVLGGLLKSLAGVRQNSPPEKGSINFNHGITLNQDSEVKLRRVEHKEGDDPVLNLMNKNDTEQPKLVHKIFDSKNNNSRKQEEVVPSWKRQPNTNRNTNIPKSVAMVTTQIDDDIPSWKINLESRKVEKNMRSKSEASVFDDSDNDFGKLTWQRDAAKRIAKNKNFVDPEKVKIVKVRAEEDILNMNNSSKTSDSYSSNISRDKRKLEEVPISPQIGKKMDRPISPVNNRKPPERPMSPVNNRKLPERPMSPINSRKPLERSMSPVNNRQLPERPMSPVNNRHPPERPQSHINTRKPPERPMPPVNNKKTPERPMSPINNRKPSVKYSQMPEPSVEIGLRSVTPIDIDNKKNNNKYRIYPDLTPQIKPSNPSLRKITPNIQFDFDKSMDTESSTDRDILNRNNNPARKLTSPKPPPIKIDISPRRYSPFEIRSDLIDIDNKLTELELRGRQLEDTIRNATTSEGEDELMNEWFKLINEKNDLVRKEADLIYINREQDLEDEQDSIDSRLRYLMSIAEEDKTQDERDEEDDLIGKKLDVINQRSNIVDSIDEDRIRYEEEDRDIAKVLTGKGFTKTDDEEVQVRKIEKKKEKKKHKEMTFISYC